MIIRFKINSTGLGLCVQIEQSYDDVTQYTAKTFQPVDEGRAIVR